MKRGDNKIAGISLGTRTTQGRSATRDAKRSSYLGFTLLELMIVITVMMILMAITVPLYTRHVTEAREAVLRQNLDTINRVIEAYRMDKGQSPQSLDDLVTAHYLPRLPIDPMTGKDDWTTDQEASDSAVDPQNPGIDRAHSAAAGNALDGTAYSTW